AVLVWAQSDGTMAHIQARSLSARGVLGPVHDLSAPDENADYPSVAMDSSGDAIMTWLGGKSFGDRTVQQRALSSSGILGPLRTLSDPVGGVQWGPAIDSFGNAVFIWVLYDGT